MHRDSHNFIAFLIIRKVSARMFNVGNFRDHMVEVFARHCGEVVNHIRSNSVGKPIEMQVLYII